MLWYLNSKTFFDLYLKNEKYQTIKKAFYVIVSDRIRRDKNVENIIINKGLLPSSHCYSMGTKSEMKSVYLNELSDNRKVFVFLASLIRESIVSGVHVIFITTKQESKIPFFRWLEEYVYKEFNYPICDYKNFIETGYIMTYNREDVLPRVKKIVMRAEREFDQNIDTSSAFGKKQLHGRLKGLSKKELQKRVVEMGLYYEGMSKSEMIDMLEAFRGM